MVIMRSNYLPVYICKILLTCLFKANGNKKLNSLSTLLKLVYGIIYIYIELHVKVLSIYL